MDATPLDPHPGGRLSRRHTRAEVLCGVRTALPAAIAIVPMGIALGVLVSQSPLPWWAATLFASVVFAGTLEFLLLGLVVAVAPLGLVALTSLLVNFRHVFYALSFPLQQIRGAGWRTMSTFILCDEAWALTSQPDAQRWSAPRILALQAVFYVNWVLSATLGALAGRLIPPGVVGLDFAVTAFFLILTLDAFRARRSVPIPVVALGCSLTFAVLAGDSMILPAMCTFVLLLLTAHGWTRRKERRA
ncbi:AzlC family ABC transporter permease [Paenibacillus sp. TRM 82003]|uniref:AzlC family ABC transporter permease n=1 Tax=Kineococcus sp. TRM81007 TaxID=2925831 RepID=UPI001F5A5707|nr:AzlC family ABC transporter permease [Kineococcus sp. TRM81007]MCI2237239.1 AzlC family ABC transporter permease [Kineococcus sp. TRM81007]MCI3919421.1 AzlC family ABC transporter permease [Paenibacillus sp. TRM 82003]